MRDTTAQTRVLELEKTKTTQQNKIDSLKRRVKKLERRNRSRNHKLKRLYKVSLTARVELSNDEDLLGEDASKQERRIDAINADKENTLMNVQDDAEMFDVDDLGELEALKTSTPKVRGIVIQEQEEPGYKINLMKKKDLQERDKKEQEANIALIETWDDVQAKINADYQLAKRLQAEEQEELYDAEKATLFMQLLEKRRKFFIAKRVEEKRNKPPTQAKQRKIMCTYLNNMKGYTLKQLKSFEFDKIQEMFDKDFKRINTFKDFRTELVQGKEKRAEEELIKGSTKKQKVKDDKETAELKQLMEIIPYKEEVAIDAIPLAVKSLGIIDWKIYKEGKKSYYQIMRADGKSQMYMVFSKMLEIFDREDLVDLYQLVKAKFKSTRPMEDLDLLLWGDLKTMFEPHVEDEVWKSQQVYKVLEWKLYDSCGVHSLRMQSI
uniref:Uncharacterized protein n=1 Tax=Tanacetum cinerariifolium TaxID=118510 RepID=A0A6L2P656_TANCI|nr:hypothetical protein [Tanacetum cinerariifolium]